LLKAVAAAADAGDKERSFDRAAAVAQLDAVLADPALARENFTALTDSAEDVAKGLALTPPERARLLKTWDPLLARWADDGSLSRADRLSAVIARVELARLDAGDGALPPNLVNDVRFAARRAERETTDKYERQAVVSAAAYALREAGLMDESDAMLKAELNRSHSPYYFMLSLGANARKRGDYDAA